MRKIAIESGDIRLEAFLNDSETARKIAGILPVEGSASVWGDEIYFSIPVDIEQAEDANEEVEAGDLAFWPSGGAFCIFFGPTPVSMNEKPRAISPVNIFGHIERDARILKSVSNGDPVIIKSV